MFPSEDQVRAAVSAGGAPPHLVEAAAAGVMKVLQTIAAQGGSPVMLWQGETWALHDRHSGQVFDADGNPLRSYVHSGPVDAPPGTKVALVVIEDAEA